MEKVLRNSKPDSRLEELLSSLLASGVSLRIRVTGPSMSPFIRSGEVVTLRRVPPTRLSIGDVILFVNHTGNLVLHRIVRIRGNTGRQGVDGGSSGIDPAGGTVKTCKSVGEEESATSNNGWRIQTKGDAAGIDPPITESNILAKVVCIEKSTPFMSFQNLHLESPLWKLYGIALVLILALKSSAIGSFLRPFYRIARPL